MSLFGLGGSSKSYGMKRQGKTVYGKDGKLAANLDKYLNNWKVKKDLKAEGLTTYEQRKLREALAEGIGDKTHVSDYEIKKMLERHPGLHKVLRGETPTKAGREILEEVDEVDGSNKFNVKKYGGRTSDQDDFSDNDLENN
jgi:hypothetical protein